MATFTLPGGGDLAAAAYRGAATDLLLSGGGALTLVAHRPRSTDLLLSGGGDPTGSGTNPRVGAIEITPAVLQIAAQPLTLGEPPEPPPPGLEMTLASTTLTMSPGPLTVSVSNGTPGADVTFTITGQDDVGESVFDDIGALSTQILVSVPTAGTYTLVATDAVTSLTASADVTVTTILTAQTIGAPVTTPPPAVQPTTGVRKWVFQDPANNETYHFDINPNRMTSPFAPKRVTFAATTAVDGRSVVFEGQPNPVEWQFEGSLIAKAQYDELLRWKNKRNRIWITDHRGRAWLCYLTNFAPQDRRSANHPWSHDYTMTALIFEGPVTPT